MNNVINLKDRRYDNWNKVVPDDTSTYPDNGSNVTYRFHPDEDFDSEWEGTYEDGIFFSRGGFCDVYDVTHWKYT
jgi:hypothetical protein